MEIQVNDQTIDFTLEGERTLGEVVEGLERWLAGAHLVLYSVLLGGRDLLSLPPEQWASKLPTEADRLEVTVRRSEELVRANLKTVAEFLEMARNFAAGAEADPQLGAELARGLEPLADSLRRHFPAAEVDRGLAGLEALLNEARREAGGVEARRRIVPELDDLRERVQRRLEELEDPHGAQRRLLCELRECGERAAEVPLLLQTGRDREAMAAIVRFSELIQTLVRLLDAAPLKAIDGRKPGEFFAELNRILKELIEAFEAKDSVLIGDLMEYEIAPRIRKLQAALG